MARTDRRRRPGEGRIATSGYRRLTHWRPWHHGKDEAQAFDRAARRLDRAVLQRARRSYWVDRAPAYEVALLLGCKVWEVPEVVGPFTAWRQCRGCRAERPVTYASRRELDADGGLLRGWWCPACSREVAQQEHLSQ